MTSFTGFVIYAFCMIGCGLTAFHLGRQTGIESTVAHLINIGALEVDEETEE